MKTAKKPSKEGIRKISKAELFSKTQGKSSTLFQLGFNSHMNGDFEQAVDYYLRALDHGPEARIHIHLAHALRQMGELDAAIFECRRALKLEPKNGNALNDLGAYLLEKKKYKEAEKILIKAAQAKDNENKEYTHYNLAKFYMQQGMLLRASKELRASTEINPSFQMAQEFLTQVQSQLH